MTLAHENENGKYFMYHNHGFEFIKLDGKPIYRHIMENFSPDELGFTFDTYWVQHAGADPAYWLNEISGRAPCIHLKDHTWDGKMAVIGEGNINFDKIFSVAEKAGVEYMLVEQDNCYDEDPFECLNRSYKNLSALGFKYKKTRIIRTCLKRHNFGTFRFVIVRRH